MDQSSDAGRIYDIVRMFCYWWNWTDHDFYQMTIRKRSKMIQVLLYQVEKWAKAARGKKGL